MDIWHYFFDWYHGQVWPNLVASVVTTFAVWVFSFRKLVKQNRKHHEDMKQHVSSEFAKLRGDADLSQFTKITEKAAK